ncbi:MAG: hypothetical protein ACLQAT_04295 [Candidatus Binataceae bacterium]
MKLYLQIGGKKSPSVVSVWTLVKIPFVIIGYVVFICFAFVFGNWVTNPTRAGLPSWHEV